MNNIFYPKLAASNLRKNSRAYFPYILSSIFTIVTFYSIFSLAQNPGLSELPGGDAVRVLFCLGVIIVGIFSVALLFYTNSFLIKQRKKELGLYSILGMEKRHIARVLLFEVLFTALISITLGVLGGILIEKLLFLALLALLKIETPVAFSISPSVILITMILFAAIFFLTLLTNLLQIKLANPITLLRGGEHGEREPKTKWILTIIGFAALGTGYWIAITVSSPMDALGLFFVAVLAVIIGTYCLFTAGSIAVLKLLKKNKTFYYRPNNFISISGMIYRMKQNAVGLANICILSTMVLVTVSTTVSLYAGQEDMLLDRHPRDVGISFYDLRDDDSGEMLSTAEEERAKLSRIIDQVCSEYEVTAEDQLEYKSYFGNPVERRGNEFYLTKDFNSANGITTMTWITLDDYNRMEKAGLSLAEDEVMVFSSSGTYGADSLQLGELKLKVSKDLDSLPFIQKNGDSSYEQYVVVMKDETAVGKAFGAFFPGDVSELVDGASTYFGFNLKAEDPEIAKAASKRMEELVRKGVNASFSFLYSTRDDWYGTYGGFLFLGIFLGALFMMAAILIIYYKQISEGYDDHDRFEIMQKVGLSKKEVKKTIHKQVLMVFFLPLAVAVLHTVVAFNVIKRILLLFGLTNIWIFAVCTAVTILFFAAVYFIVYTLTAKSYYKIVEQQ